MQQGHLIFLTHLYKEEHLWKERIKNNIFILAKILFRKQNMFSLYLTKAPPVGLNVLVTVSLFSLTHSQKEEEICWQIQRGAIRTTRLPRLSRLWPQSLR